MRKAYAAVWPTQVCYCSKSFPERGGAVTTCALVATCDFNARQFEKLDSTGAFDEVYAVDAGYAHLQRIGRNPDIALGDFDSLGYVPRHPHVEQHPAHKDESDLELAFDYACAHGVDEAYVFGAIGGRLDHTIAALQMAARFAEGGMVVTFVTPECCIRILVGPDAYEIPVTEKGTVSVFSATDASTGVTETGMEYPLDDATLTNRTSLGLSNELIGVPASVSVCEGTLYVFHPLP